MLNFTTHRFTEDCFDAKVSASDKQLALFFYMSLQNADIPILFCMQRVLLLVGLFYTGLLPFIPIKEEFLEIPMPSIILK